MSAKRRHEFKLVKLPHDTVLGEFYLTEPIIVGLDLFQIKFGGITKYSLMLISSSMEIPVRAESFRISESIWVNKCAIPAHADKVLRALPFDVPGPSAGFIWALETKIQALVFLEYDGNVDYEQKVTTGEDQ